jgi:hypothetical protein
MRICSVHLLQILGGCKTVTSGSHTPYWKHVSIYSLFIYASLSIHHIARCFRVSSISLTEMLKQSSMLNNVQYIMYNVQCTMYNGQLRTRRKYFNCVLYYGGGDSAGGWVTRPHSLNGEKIFFLLQNIKTYSDPTRLLVGAYRAPYPRTERGPAVKRTTHLYDTVPRLGMRGTILTRPYACTACA